MYPNGSKVRMQKRRSPDSIVQSNSTQIPITGRKNEMSDFGSLNDYLAGAAVKRLTAVECDPTRSNGHEINATSMKAFMGAEARSGIPTTFVRLGDDEEDIESVEGTCSWWFRDRTAQGKGIEYRLYYQDNPAITKAETGDALAVIMKPNKELRSEERRVGKECRSRERRDTG